MLRLPAVSGTFYPDSPQELLSLIDAYARAEKPAASFRACLVPHAGYVYSGRVAGKVYARTALPNRMIVLGVRHFPYGEDAAILSHGAWRTPLGDVEIDADLAGQISRACPLLREDDVAHQAEHSLEVQLPFLQRLAPAFRFVPIALGTLKFDELTAVGHALATVLSHQPDVMIVATTDLNHYEDERTTRRKDLAAIEKILLLDTKGLFDVCRAQKISMCGLGPTVALLTALNELGLKNAKLVEHTTSAEYSGDTRRVVGYAGFLFS